MGDENQTNFIYPTTHETQTPTNYYPEPASILTEKSHYRQIHYWQSQYRQIKEAVNRTTEPISKVTPSTQRGNYRQIGLNTVK